MTYKSLLSSHVGWSIAKQQALNSWRKDKTLRLNLEEGALNASGQSFVVQLLGAFDGK